FILGAGGSSTFCQRSDPRKSFLRGSLRFREQSTSQVKRPEGEPSAKVFSGRQDDVVRLPAWRELDREAVVEPAGFLGDLRRTRPGFGFLAVHERLAATRACPPGDSFQGDPALPDRRIVDGVRAVGKNRAGRLLSIRPVQGDDPLGDGLASEQYLAREIVA